MDTKIIYTNKEGAKVKNDVNGEWINEVPSVIVKAGDLVSVESIAVSTDGTGSDVIEIPRQIKDYKYITNSMAIEFMVYIHQNYQYTCMMPITHSGNDGDIYTTQTALNYGDFKPDIFTIIHNQNYRPKNGIPTQTYAGSRMYIGTYGDAVDLNIYDPMKSTTLNDPLLSTGNKVFNFLTTKIPFEVDYGYNTPQNIASKITFDLKSAMKTANRNNYDDVITNEVEPNFGFSVGGTDIQDKIQQLTATNSQGSVITINAIPNQYYGKTADGANPYWYASYSNWLAVANPFYWYWGSRLNAQSPNGTEKMNAWALEKLGGNLTQADIINLLPLRNDGTNTTIQTGDIIATNLPFTPDAVKKLAELIHAQKKYTGGTLHATAKTQEQMIKDKTNFVSFLPLGKYDDGQNTPWTSNSKLESKVLTLADTCEPSYFKVKSFYQGYEYINDVDLYNPASVAGINYVGINFVFQGVWNNMKITDICELYDINIRLILTITTSGTIEYTIGLVMEEYDIDNEIILAGNFAVVDLTFSRDEASASMILSPEVYDKQAGSQAQQLPNGINVGAPEIQLTFNSDRSRFSWKDMYWRNYLGNDPTATDPNPSADAEVYTSNKNITSGGDYYTPLQAQLANVVFDKYAQSGLGIYKIWVKGVDGFFIPIDEEDPDDINEKYEKSVLHRIGFDFDDLINTFGLPNVFYQERMMKGQLRHKFPQYFPYPLTCNPQVDVAINQSLSVNTHSLPTFTLSLQNGYLNINIAVSTAEILASNKPTKLATPFWLIEADILPALKYYVDGNPRNIMAICNRAYGSGDFVFSFATDYKFIATKDFVLTHIKQNVLTSDLLPADIEDNTTIVYKVESPILPNFVSAQMEMEEENEEMMKGKK
jgi:hypothetical protein